MHDNPQVATDLVFALPGHRVLAFSGRDAAAFAQAQFMNDVNAIAPGQWQWNGWLNPKGRVLALFALLKLDAEILWLLLPDADPPELASALQRFVFRSKVSLAVRDDLHVTGSHSVPKRARAAQWDGAPDASIELDMGGDGGARTLRIGVTTAAADAAGADRWSACDLQHGLPRLPASQSGQWTPQQLSLERLRGFSIKKGCYPGQEIVARTHFLGKAKRGLALLETTGAIAAGASVVGESGALGTVACAVSLADTSLALAVLPLDHSTQGLSIDGHTAIERPLLDGLQR